MKKNQNKNKIIINCDYSPKKYFFLKQKSIHKYQNQSTIKQLKKTHLRKTIAI